VPTLAKLIVKTWAAGMDDRPGTKFCAFVVKTGAAEASIEMLLAAATAVDTSVLLASTESRIDATNGGGEHDDSVTYAVTTELAVQGCTAVIVT